MLCGKLHPQGWNTLVGLYSTVEVVGESGHEIEVVWLMHACDKS